MSQTSSAEAYTYLWLRGGHKVEWDGLRKDVELWDAAGDCLIYLYAKGSSKRPASIRVPLSFIEDAGCMDLLAMVDDNSSTSNGPGSEGSSADERTTPSTADLSQLYLGAPKNLDRDETYRWHLTTRNFFAWLTDKPLAGPHLGLALSDLLNRLRVYCASSGRDPLDDVLVYADQLGYTCLAHRPDYAAGMLVFAQEQQLTDLWIDAFSHCVGMNEHLADSPDVEMMGAVSRALIAKSSLQMDIGLENKAHAIGSLLEDDFGAHLGLTQSAQRHLDEFRSFLCAHFVEAHGYWPPRKDRFPKKVYSSIKDDFESLYGLLADFSSHEAHNTSRLPASGGICVLQNLTAFDERNELSSLDAVLPLVPEVDYLSRKQSNRQSLFSLVGGKDKNLARTKLRTAHLLASNGHEHNWQRTNLLKSFLEFETNAANIADSQLSNQDARRVRWMLVYGMLQMLKSVLASAPSVTDQNDVLYPLCCNTKNLPSWSHNELAYKTTSSHDFASRNSSPERISIHPDGETDYDKYFSSSTNDMSHIHPALRPKPLRTKSEMSRMSAPRAISRVFSMKSSYIPSRKASTIAESPRSGRESLSSETPSLDWSSHDSRTSQEYSSSEHRQSERRFSTSSSVYSERAILATEKPLAYGDVFDKGLAFDDFICPGLY